MAVGDSTIIVGAVMILNYLMLWQHGWLRRVIADIFFIAIGMATYLIVSTDFPWGIIITAIAGVDLLLQLAKV
jgi:hypothetical protein